MFKRAILWAAAAGLVLALEASAGAAPVAIVNPGFETHVLADGDWSWLMDNEGWGYVANGGNLGPWNPEADYYGGNAPEGQNVGWTNPGTEDGGFGQVLTETLAAGMTYTLTVKVGNTAGYDWSGYRVQLLAGGTPQASGDGSDYAGEVTGGFLLAEDNNTVTIADDTFGTSTVTYVYNPAHSAYLGKPLQIRLLCRGGGTGEEEVDFDGVRLDAVPEPATLALLGLGGLSVLLGRKHR
jgi:hypothetical protein